jgi:hypothetical protein
MIIDAQVSFLVRQWDPKRIADIGVTQLGMNKHRSVPWALRPKRREF